jgi:Tfp pilus assembly protein PilX
MRISFPGRLRAAASRDDGFTMLFALLALLVSGLLVAAAFTSANGDIKLTSRSTVRAKAYYAALAGIQRYQYEMSTNPNYWVKCPSLTKKPVPETTDEEFTVKTLGSIGHSSGCTPEDQPSILETSGAAKGTFRILSTGTAGSGTEKVTRAIVGSFEHPGFTKFVYESNYEVEDPANFTPEPTECKHYYAYRSAHNLTEECPAIEFAPGDKVNGPMHTNDAAAVCTEGTSKPSFGRAGKEDEIAMNGGHYAANSGCSNTPEILGNKYTEEAGSIEPPETDTELLAAADYKFTGRTEIELKAGSPNTMAVTDQGVTLPVKSFPEDGVVYVTNASTGCSITKYSPFNTDTTHDTGCGNVYVHGTYTESLTIASADDVIVNGDLTTTHGATGEEPTGGATLGLIAENFVRVYHPVRKHYELKNYEPSSEAATSQEIAAEACGTGIVTRTGTLKSGFGTKEITGLSSTTGLSNGMEVIGENIPSGTTITLKTSTSVGLSRTPERNNVTEAVTFYRPLANGYEYAPSLQRCVAPPESGYTFHESENLDVKGSCESSTTYTGEGFCEYENNSKRCSSKASNMTVVEDPNGWGTNSEPIIDAAILSTKHSWIVDNYKCGAKLEKLTVWGSIAQYWRGPVGEGGSPGHGYLKNYNYDQRLASQQPPSFLSPTSTTWKLSRETEPPAGFTG